MTTSQPPRPVEFWIVTLRTPPRKYQHEGRVERRDRRRDTVEHDVVGARLDAVLGGRGQSLDAYSSRTPAIVKPSTRHTGRALDGQLRRTALVMVTRAYEPGRSRSVSPGIAPETDRVLEPVPGETSRTGLDGWVIVSSRPARPESDRGEPLPGRSHRSDPEGVRPIRGQREAGATRVCSGRGHQDTVAIETIAGARRLPRQPIVTVCADRLTSSSWDGAFAAAAGITPKARMSGTATIPRSMS